MVNSGVPDDALEVMFEEAAFGRQLLKRDCALQRYMRSNPETMNSHQWREVGLTDY